MEKQNPYLETGTGPFNTPLPSVIRIKNSLYIASHHDLWEDYGISLTGGVRE